MVWCCEVPTHSSVYLFIPERNGNSIRLVLFFLKRNGSTRQCAAMRGPLVISIYLGKKDSMAHVLLLFPLEKEFIHVRMFSLTWILREHRTSLVLHLPRTGKRLAPCNVENAFSEEKLIPLEIASNHIYPSNVTAEAQAFSTLNRICLLSLRLCLGTKDLDRNAEI
jgi:hypothetical protein